MNILQIGGIVSGMDTDKVVRDLMRIERMRADKILQKKQVLEWKKAQFRAITNKVRVFKENYFDILKPSTNLTSLNALKKMSVASSEPGIVTATAGTGAQVGQLSFQVVQSATAAKVSAGAITSGSAGGERLSLSDTMETISGKLANGEFTFDENGSFSLNLNGETVAIHKAETLRQVIAKINDSRAGVQAAYSSFSDTFTLTAKETGDQWITTDNGGGFFTALGVAVNEGRVGESGRDAVFKIDGYEGTRSANTFTIDGMTYSIHGLINAADSSPAVSITTAVDVDGIYSTIEKFVQDYNALIEEINGKLYEEAFRDFPPLTDLQKETMKDSEIEKWEEKAQSGLLRRETALENMLREMRRVLSDMVGDLHLSEIGIETSANYRENGKLVLKNGGESLRQAIAANPDKVADLFTRRSDIAYSPNLTAAERTQRYSESGLAQRLSDILSDNIRITRDSYGRKGFLLERAGVEGDTTQFNNYYDKQIADLNKSLDRLNEVLSRRESQYYRQFTAMEKALQQLYSQGDWLAAQMNQLSGTGR